MSKDLPHFEAHGNLEAEVAFFFSCVTSDRDTRNEKLSLKLEVF